MASCSFPFELAEPSIAPYSPGARAIRTQTLHRIIGECFLRVRMCCFQSILHAIRVAPVTEPTEG
jgi:hypothetical protein